MRDFWEHRAHEDAFYFVDNRIPYGADELESFWAEGEKDLAILLDRAGVALKPDDVVVEIGCGVGRLTRVLAAQAAQVHALDISQRMLDIAADHNGHLGNVDWLLGDGGSLAQIEAGSADACVSHVVFQHIPDPEVTLDYVREIGRVLKPGGWAAFQVSNDPEVHRRRQRPIREKLAALMGRAPRGLDGESWRGAPTDLDDLAGAARDGGMQVASVDGAGTQYCLVCCRAPNS